jgi:hypothetical protein
MIPNLEPARMRTEHHATLAHENSALSSPLLAEARAVAVASAKQ